MLIRTYHLDDVAILRRVFHASVHGLACRFYSEAQLHAWAPLHYNEAEWAEKLAVLRPWLVEIDGRVVAYADVQPDGMVEHFFVLPEAARQGVGTALMAHLHQEAAAYRLAQLSAHVSLAAQAFFAKQGFAMVQSQTVWVRGVALSNALMTKQLSGQSEAVAGATIATHPTM